MHAAGLSHPEHPQRPHQKPFPIPVLHAFNIFVLKGCEMASNTSSEFKGSLQAMSIIKFFYQIQEYISINLDYQVNNH